MTALRILNVALWAAVAVFMARGAWASVTGRAHWGDPMRLACFLTALIMCGFCLRWLVAPDEMVSWQLLYVLGAVDAILILRLGVAYGRGNRL